MEIKDCSQIVNEEIEFIHTSDDNDEDQEYDN